MYDFVDTGAIGTDAIKVGIIYESTTSSPVGVTPVLDDPAFTNLCDAVIPTALRSRARQGASLLAQ